MHGLAGRERIEQVGKEFSGNRLISTLLFFTAGFFLVTRADAAPINSLESLNRAFLKSGRNIEKTLAQLPSDMKNNVIIMFRSESLQVGTCQHPRLISFSEDGNFVATIGGDPKNEGFDAIEAREFNPTTWRLSYQEFSSNNTHQTVQQRQGVNAPACMACHSPSTKNNHDPRSNWRPYQFWNGAAGAFDDFVPRQKPVGIPLSDSFSDPENFDDKTPSNEIFDENFNASGDGYAHVRKSRAAFVSMVYAFKKSAPSEGCLKVFETTWRQNPRYKHFTGIDRVFNTYYDTDPSRKNPSLSMNMKYTALTYKVNGLRLARMISEHPESERLAKALIGAGQKGLCPSLQGDPIKILQEHLGPSELLLPLPFSARPSLAEDLVGLSDGQTENSYYYWVLYGLTVKKPEWRKLFEVNQIRTQYGAENVRPRTGVSLALQVKDSDELCRVISNNYISSGSTAKKGQSLQR